MKKKKKAIKRTTLEKPDKRLQMTLYFTAQEMEDIERDYAAFVNETQMRPAKSEFVQTLIRRQIARG